MLNITFITYTHITCSFIGKYICKLTLISYLNTILPSKYIVLYDFKKTKSQKPIS